MNELPDSLITAIKAAHLDRDIAPQGYPALRDYLLRGGERPADLDEWINHQLGLLDWAGEIVRTLSPTPGELPRFFVEWWFPILRMPWAEDLAVAVAAAQLSLADA